MHATGRTTKSETFAANSPIAKRVQTHNVRYPKRWQELCEESQLAATKLGQQLAEAKRVAGEWVQKFAEAQRVAAELSEWKEAVYSAVSYQPGFSDGHWGGDKKGWGFVFEFVNWMGREITDLQKQLAARSERERKLRSRLIEARNLFDNCLGLSTDSQFDRDGLDRDGRAWLATVDAALAAAPAAPEQAKPPENWPNLTHQMRDKLHALCQAAGVIRPDQWLSEAACEAIEKLTAARDVAEADAAALAEALDDCHAWCVIPPTRKSTEECAYRQRDRERVALDAHRARVAGGGIDQAAAVADALQECQPSAALAEEGK